MPTNGDIALRPIGSEKAQTGSTDKEGPREDQPDLALDTSLIRNRSLYTLLFQSLGE